jgi:hypothetical protein
MTPTSKRKTEITKIVNNNILLLDNITRYICTNIKCNIQDILIETKDYIVKLLQYIRTIKFREVLIRNERKKIVEDLNDLQNAYVGGDNLTINETGKNTGQKENQVYLRQIKMLELKEQLQDKMNESLVLEKSLDDSTKIIKDFIELIPNPQQQIILIRMYLKCESASLIAEDFFFSPGTIQVYRKRGTACLTDILNTYLSRKK